MRRHIPGLHSRQQDPETNLDGSFLVRVERAAYRWNSQKPYLGTSVRYFRTEGIGIPRFCRAAIQHGESTMETQLVSA